MNANTIRIAVIICFFVIISAMLGYYAYEMFQIQAKGTALLGCVLMGMTLMSLLAIPLVIHDTADITSNKK